MFNDRYGLTKAVLEERKTMTRRLVPHGTPLENWEDTVKKSRYQVGEVVAVAQRYEEAISPLDWVNRLLYKDEPGWKNKMFVRADLMPHKIRITNIRIERLQDISDEDCLREGIEKDGDVYSFNDYEGYKTPKLAFKALINRISGKGTWESNPWVYAYEFELVK